MSAGRVARAKDFASLRLYRVPHPSRVCSGGVVRPLAVVSRRGYIPAVPWGLKRFQQSRHLHFVTFSCYRRRPLLDSSGRRELVERALENARRSYRFFVTGYVVMPEHVHLLVSEPERGLLATAIQAMKQSVARRLTPRNSGHFWQARYYDFNVWSEHKRLEKLNYMHWNPVKRGLHRVRKIGCGAAFAIMRPAVKEPWRLSPSGRRGEESAWVLLRKQSLNESEDPTRANPARVGHPRE